MVERLRYALKEVKPFKIIFSGLKYFEEEHNSVAWLDPTSEVPLLMLFVLHHQTDFLILRYFFQKKKPREALGEVQRKICSILSVAKVSFSFHLTVGQFPQDKVSAFIEETHQTWVPLTFTVDHLDIIARDSASSPFTVRHVVPFQIADGLPCFIFLAQNKNTDKEKAKKDKNHVLYCSAASSLCVYRAASWEA